MAESTVGWFDVRKKYCSLADKQWLISQIRPSEQADNLYHYSSYRASKLFLAARAIRSKGQNLYTWHGNNKIQIRKQGGEPLALEEGFSKRTRTTSQSFSR